MAIVIKLAQSQFKRKENRNKWYAQTVSQGEMHTNDIAKRIEENTTFTRGEVKGMIDALVDTMTDMLKDGRTVVLDGFGRFRLVAESVSVDSPADFSIMKNIKGVRCNFLPSGRRNNASGTVAKTFCDGTKVVMAAKYSVEK